MRGIRISKRLCIFTVLIMCIGLIWSGAAMAARCGNGKLNKGEQCDEGNLNGHSCQTQGFTYGTLACSTSCTLDTSGCTNEQFIDNGDGTITDNQTGLMWEKKSDDGSVHDKDNTYTWSSSGTDPDGTAFASFLGVLNGFNGFRGCTSSDGNTVTCSSPTCFAGHCDWRLPEINELKTIVETDTNPVPAVNPIFNSNCTSGCAVTSCSCTAVSSPEITGYWSSTSIASNADFAWNVLFDDGILLGDPKGDNFYVRAVRGSQ